MIQHAPTPICRGIAIGMTHTHTLASKRVKLVPVGRTHDLTEPIAPTNTSNHPGGCTSITPKALPGVRRPDCYRSPYGMA